MADMDHLTHARSEYNPHAVGHGQPPSPHPARWLATLALACSALSFASPVAAQTAEDEPAAYGGSEAAAAAQAPLPPDPNAGNVTLTTGFDLVSGYMFRGIRQHSDGLALWPFADVGVAFYSGDGGVKSAALNFGSWNSLHTGDTGTDGPSGKLWYESDFYVTFGLGFGGGTSLATTYTAYASPNNTFTSVKELAFKLSVDDSAAMGRAALKPYALVAFELDTEPGVGQADGGLDAGKYLELGVAPGWSGARASLAVPVKVGLSLGDYYELDGDDNGFGYVSIAGIVTVPITGVPTSFGSWNVHGGIEVQALGKTTEFYNGGDAQRVIGSIGFGFAY
jgi:hypothetical protein